MAIDFPATPSTNDTHTHNGLTWTFDGTTWKINTTVQSGTTTFTGLTDTPSSYTGQGGNFIKVNSATNALEFGTGGGATDKIEENDTSVECIDDGTGDRIEFKTSGTEAVQIDANRQILISGTQSGNNVAKIYNDTDGAGTGVLGIYASSNNATPRDVRIYSGGGTANEIFRAGKDGQIGVGGDVGTAGQVLTSGGSSGAATWSTASGGANVTTSDTAPSSPSDGDLWWDSQNGRLLVYYEDTNSSQWVDASGRGVNNSGTSFSTSNWSVPL